jgi:colicin import membrane protein
VESKQSTSWLRAQGATQDEMRRTAFLRALLISVAGHAVLALVLVWVPSSKPSPLPPSIAVRLVAPSVVAQAGRASVAPAAAKPAPRPAPAKPKPVRTPEKVLLPKQPAAVRRKPVKKRRPKPEPMAYEDALDALREEMGEETPQPQAAATEESEPEDGGESGPAATEGFQVTAEVAAWMTDTKRHLRRVWITPPEFLNRGLVTELRVYLGADGTVLGTPEVVRSSGDPFWDDNTIRALMRGSPLPAPPEPGEWPFIFTPEDRR